MVMIGQKRRKVLFSGFTIEEPTAIPRNQSFRRGDFPVLGCARVVRIVLAQAQA